MSHDILEVWAYAGMIIALCLLASAGITWLRTHPHQRRRPYDWQVDWPEFGYAKDTHVTLRKEQ